MASSESRGKRLVNAILGSHYTLPIASVILFLILGAALYGVLVDTGYMRDQIKHEFNQQQLILARQASQRIGNELTDVSVEIRRLGRTLTRQGGQPSASEQLQTTLDYNLAKGLMEVGLISPGGTIISSASEEAWSTSDAALILSTCLSTEMRVTVLGDHGLQQTNQGQPIITGVLCTMLSGDRYDGTTLYGIINVTRLVRNATEGIRSGRTGYAWVINEDGMFLYHPEEEFIGKNAFTARAEREPYISFNEINSIMKNRMLQAEEGTGQYVSGWHRGQTGEITKLIAFSPVVSDALPRERLWSVAVSAPTSEVAAAVEEVRTRHLLTEIAMLAAMLGFALLVTVYQRRISRALKRQVSEQEEFISAILQNSVDAIIFIDNDNTVKMWNKGAEMIFGYTPQEMLGSRFRRLIPPDMDADEELGRIQEEVYRVGHIRNYQTQRLTKSGRRITVNISRTLLHNNEGSAIGSTAIIKDVSEKVEMDKHIYNTEKLASIGILAAGVAHEINNPLAIILGFTDLLKERFDEGAPEYEDLKMIEDNANHAKAIVENLLGFARITEGLEDNVDVTSSLETVANIVRNTLVTRKVELVTNIGSDLPPVAGDAREFQQVVFNLINNAVASMDEKGGTITLSAWKENFWVKVQVKDDGSGIPDRIKARIFDPFFTTKKVGQGTGLGLSLCYGIVQKYGGKIEFESVAREDHPDKPSGTTFTVSMPVYREKPVAKGADA
jgi:two-component system NtrC family sensor kinase